MSADGAVRRALRRLLQRTPAGVIEVPASGTGVAPGRLEVAGWATVRKQLLRTIEIRVDGRDAGRARPFSISRPDVDAATSGIGAAVAGFEHVVEIPADVDRSLRIDADVVGVDGVRHPVAPVFVDVRPSALSSVGDLPPPAPPLPREASGRPVRVAVFTNSLGIGGGPLYLQDILRSLLADPAFSFLVISRFDGPLRAELEALGAKVHIIEFPVWSAVDYERTVGLLCDVVEHHESDVVLVNSMPAGIGADIGVRLRIPVVWSIHESYTLADLWRSAFGADGLASDVRARLEWGLAHSTVLIFEADATRDVYEPSAAPGRAVTVRYGIATQEIKEYRASHDRDTVRRSLGLDPTATVVLCIGTFEPRKAQASVALAFAEIADEYPDAVLALVGALDGGYSDGVRTVVEQTGLADRVRVVPIVEDAFPWYFAADALVSASDVESMPRSMLEAMAFRVPVAAASVWGIPELVEHGRNGLLFPPRDLGALRDALGALIELSPQDANRMGAMAEEIVDAHYDIAGFVEAYRRLLPAVAARPDADPHVLVSGREPVA